MFESKVRAAHFLGTTAHQSEAATLVKEPGDAVLVNRGVPRSLVLRCPDGCGELLTVNLDPRSGPAWRLYVEDNHLLTLFPSVWRDTGCHAHFILWDNAIHWTNERWTRRRRPPLEERVLKTLNQTPRHFTEIAASLDAIPWAVLHACYELVDRGRAIEGVDEAKGFFRTK